MHSDRPIFLVLTKSDLLNNSEVHEPVTKEKLEEEARNHNLQGVMVTSSMKWEDFNVHKAFIVAILSTFEML